jgi:hypothetical protein
MSQEVRMLIPIMVGALLGVLFVLVIRRAERGRQVRLLAVGLAVTALIYVVVALPQTGLHWVGVEIVGVAIYGSLAWLGAKVSPWWLVLGWAGHVAWDMSLHLDTAHATVPVWYPFGCAGFDLIVAGYLISLTSGTALRRQ